MLTGGPESGDEDAWVHVEGGCEPYEARQGGSRLASLDRSYERSVRTESLGQCFLAEPLGFSRRSHAGTELLGESRVGAKGSHGRSPSSTERNYSTGYK